MARVSKDPVTFHDGLAILFVGLKLTGAIGWSWWLVLLPLYGPFLLAGTITAITEWNKG